MVDYAAQLVDSLLVTGERPPTGNRGHALPWAKADEPLRILGVTEQLRDLDKSLAAAPLSPLARAANELLFLPFLHMPGGVGVVGLQHRSFRKRAVSCHMAQRDESQQELGNKASPPTPSVHWGVFRNTGPGDPRRGSARLAFEAHRSRQNPTVAAISTFLGIVIAAMSVFAFAAAVWLFIWVAKTDGEEDRARQHDSASADAHGSDAGTSTGRTVPESSSGPDARACGPLRLPILVADGTLSRLVQKPLSPL